MNVRVLDPMDNCSPVSDVVFRQHLRSASSHQLSVPRYRLSTYGRRVFSVAGRTAGLSRKVERCSRHDVTYVGIFAYSDEDDDERGCRYEQGDDHVRLMNLSTAAASESVNNFPEKNCITYTVVREHALCYSLHSSQEVFAVSCAFNGIASIEKMEQLLHLHF